MKKRNKCITNEREKKRLRKRSVECENKEKTGLYRKERKKKEN